MVGGIAAGVALIAALGIINVSVLSNFRASLERAAGKAALQVVLGTGEVGFDEARRRGRRRRIRMSRTPSGWCAGGSRPRDDSGDTLQLFGVDLTTEAIDSYDVQPVGRGDRRAGVPERPAVGAADRGVRRAPTASQVDDRVPFASPKGIERLHVRGLLRAEGLATVFGGQPGGDGPAGGAAAARQGGTRRPGGRAAAARVRTWPAVQQRLAASLPSSLSVIRPALRGERFERVIGAFQAMLDGLSLLCLLAGVFIVYNTSATAVMQRARDFAIMLAVGAERRRHLRPDADRGDAPRPRRVAARRRAGSGHGPGAAAARRPVDGRHLPDALHGGVVHADAAGRSLWYCALGVGGAVMAAIVPARKASRLDPLRADAARLPRAARDRGADGTLVLVGVLLLALTVVGAQRSSYRHGPSSGGM